jgi:hypothetical protein
MPDLRGMYDILEHIFELVNLNHNPTRYRYIPNLLIFAIRLFLLSPLMLSNSTYRPSPLPRGYNPDNHSNTEFILDSRWGSGVNFGGTGRG